MVDLNTGSELDERGLVLMLQNLVGIKSVNPEVTESAMADAIAGRLALPGVELHRVESLPGRESLAAVLPGSSRGPRLVFNGHLDTVPVDSPDLWTAEPFGGEIRDGYVYGRGACDMKSGLVAQIAAARALLAAGGPGRGDLVLHFAVGEERAEPGTRSLCEAGFAGDVGIVTEPTQLRVASAARGMASFRVVITGQSGHASQPGNAVNPLEAVPEVLEVAERYARTRAGNHPLLPPGSFTPTMVRAGVATNAIPDSCEITFDRRLLPGQTIAGELAELRRAFGDVLASRPRLESVAVTSDAGAFEPAEISADSPFVRLVNEARASAVGQAAEVVGTPFSSDVSVLVNEAGMEAVTFGPGDIGECHCPDERVEIDQLRLAAETLFDVAVRFLGTPTRRPEW